MRNTVNLAIISEYFYPVFSGATERFRRYLPGLRERGIDVDVFTIWREGLEEKEAIDGGGIRRLHLPTSNLHPSAELSRQVLRYFRSSGNWPDVIHVISHTLQGVPFLWQMRLKGLPCINSITMDPYSENKSLIGKVKFWLHQWLRYSVFNQVIVSSQVIARSAQRCGISTGRIKVINNGVDITRFHPIENAGEKFSLRQNLGFDLNDFIILFVGFISRRKGVDLLLQAWPEILIANPHARLVLVGPYDRDGSFTNFFQQKLSQLERVSYQGPADKVETYMQTADIFVLPSRLEGLGNVVGEGMACGLPCVLTPFKGLPESFGQPGVDYMLTGFQPAQIAADINSLIKDQARQNAIGQAALRRARETLNVEKALDLHAGVYHAWAKDTRVKK